MCNFWLKVYKENEEGKFFVEMYFVKFNVSDSFGPKIVNLELENEEKKLILAKLR